MIGPINVAFVLVLFVASTNSQSCSWGTVWDGSTCTNYGCSWAFDGPTYDLQDVFYSISYYATYLNSYSVCLVGDFTWLGPAMSINAGELIVKPAISNAVVTITQVGSSGAGFAALKDVAFYDLKFVGNWFFSAAVNAPGDSFLITDCSFIGSIEFYHGHGLQMVNSNYTSANDYDLDVITQAGSGITSLSNCVFQDIAVSTLFTIYNSNGQSLRVSDCNFTSVETSESALYWWPSVSVYGVTVSEYSGGPFISSTSPFFVSRVESSSFTNVLLSGGSGLIVCTSCDLTVRTTSFSVVNGGYVLNTDATYSLENVVMTHVFGGIAPSVDSAELVQVVLIDLACPFHSLISAGNQVTLNQVIITQSSAAGSLLESEMIYVDNSLIFDNLVSPVSVSQYGGVLMETSVFCENPASVTEVSNHPAFGTGNCATECLSMPVGPASCWQPFFESATLGIGALPHNCSCPAGGLCPLPLCRNCSVDTTTGLPFCMQCEYGLLWSSTANACVDGVTTSESSSSSSSDEGEDGLVGSDKDGKGGASGGAVVGAVIGGIVGFLLVLCGCAALVYVFVLSPSRRDDAVTSQASAGVGVPSGVNVGGSDVEPVPRGIGRISVDESDGGDLVSRSRSPPTDIGDRKLQYTPMNVNHGGPGTSVGEKKSRDADAPPTYEESVHPDLLV